MLERLPLISSYARARGWAFVISWCNRLAGILMVVYIWFHIYFLTLLKTPSSYDATMRIFEFFVLEFFQWLLAVPVIFHALNGGRLILYESFGWRNDESMTRWMIGLSIVYIAVLGLLMLMGDQTVSPFFFWLIVLVAAVILAYAVCARIWKTGHSILWKLQRVSGAFLLVLVPAHLIFMHMNPSAGMEASVVTIRMKGFFIKVVDVALLLAALYHGGYGLSSVISEYLWSRILRMGLIVLVTLLMIISAWVGIRLTISI